jgi:hypothetical protein
VLQVKTPATASNGWGLGLWGMGRPSGNKKLTTNYLQMSFNVNQIRLDAVFIMKCKEYLVHSKW